MSVGNRLSSLKDKFKRQVEEAAEKTAQVKKEKQVKKKRSLLKVKPKRNNEKEK